MKLKGKIPKTCLTNHTGSTLHHIIPLVINALGADTQKQDKTISGNQVCVGPSGAHLVYKDNLLYILYIGKFSEVQNFDVS